MVKLKYGSLSISGHSLRNKIPLVGNQGEYEVRAKQNFNQKKAEPRSPHLLCINQDIVAWFSRGKVII